MSVANVRRDGTGNPDHDETFIQPRQACSTTGTVPLTQCIVPWSVPFTGSPPADFVFHSTE